MQRDCQRQQHWMMHKDSQRCITGFTKQNNSQIEQHWMQYAERQSQITARDLVCTVEDDSPGCDAETVKDAALDIMQRETVNGSPGYDAKRQSKMAALDLVCRETAKDGSSGYITERVSQIAALKEANGLEMSEITRLAEGAQT